MKTPALWFMLSFFGLLMFSGQAAAVECPDHSPAADLQQKAQHQEHVAQIAQHHNHAALPAMSSPRHGLHEGLHVGSHKSSHDCCEDSAERQQEEQHCDTEGNCGACPVTAWVSLTGTAGKAFSTEPAHLVRTTLTSPPVLKPAMIWRPPIHA